MSLLQILSFIFPIREKGIHNFPKVHLILIIVQGFLSRIGLFFYGIIKIDTQNIDFDLTDFPKLKVEKDKPSKIICSNHVSNLDILVYFTHTSCAFIAKKEVLNMPIVGKFA